MKYSDRKKIRLPDATYQVRGNIYSITVATRLRTPVFTDLPFSRTCLRILEETSIAAEVRVFAYCLMPDHVHLLLGSPRASSAVNFIGAWKSRFYRERRRMGLGKPFWQRSFYDHILRSDEDLLKTARYILENPIRAGLVDRVDEYPLSGSFEFDL